MRDIPSDELMTLQWKWAECCVSVTSGNGQERILVLAGLNDCISFLTAITLPMRAMCALSSVGITNSL